MQAMRRYAHKLLVALLCMCLLISYTPLPASAAEGDVGPSVSESVDEATMTGENEAQMSTTVNVLALAGLTITGQTDDYAATIAQIQGDAKYDLKVSAVGKAPLSYVWTRTVDGVNDDSFSFTCDDGIYPLSQHTDTLENNKTYVYTIKVSDASGEQKQTSITVKVTQEYTDRTFEQGGVSVQAYAHWQTLLFVEALDAASPTYAYLQSAAGGTALVGAWQIDLAGTTDNKAPFTGEALVTIPVAGVPDEADVAIVGLDAAGNPLSFTAKAQGGKVTFKTAVLGAFAAAWSAPEAPTHTISATAGEGGQITPSGEVKVADGASATFTALPNEGFVLDEILVDDVAQDAPAGVYTFSSVTGNHTIKATFRAVPVDPAQNHTVSAQVEGGHGTVAVEGAVAGATSQATIAHGTSATIAFEPEAGYVIDAVKVNGTAVPVLGSSYTVSAVEADVQVVVTYKPGIAPPLPVHVVTASANEGGSITPEKVEVTHGGSAEFTVSPANGFRLKSITVDDKDASAWLEGETLTVANVVSDRAVQVEFESIPAANHTVTATASKGGSISPAGKSEVADGEGIQFYLYPEDGYRLASLMLTSGIGTPVDVTDKVSGGVFSLESVREDCTLAATFESSGIVVPEDTYYAVTANAREGGAVSPEGTVRVKAGGSVTFTFLPNQGYVLDVVRVNGTPVTCEGLSYTLSSVTANATVEATFKQASGQEPVPVTHVIEASASAGGTVSPSGKVQVLEGGSMPFTFIPLAGYELDQVLVDGTALPADQVAKGTYRFDNVRAGHSLRVTFKAVSTGPVEPDYYQLRVEAGEHGTASPLGQTRVPAGSSQTISLFPDAGYVVEKVMVAEGAQAPVDRTADVKNGTSLVLDSLAADTTVNVTFRLADSGSGEETPQVKKYTLTSSATAGGSISPAGTVEVVEGSSLAYTVAAEAGYRLKEVTVDGGAVAVQGAGFTVSDVRANHEVRAVFEAETTAPEEPTYRTITSSATGGGSVSPEGSVRVATGRSQTFYFYPQDGYQLESVKVDGQEVQPLPTNSYTFDSVENDAVLEAQFGKVPAGEDKPVVPVTHTVLASASTGGTVSPAGATRVVEGGDVLLTFTPDAGWKLSQVLLDGENALDQVRDGSLRLVGVNTDHTVRAVFERVQAEVPTRHTIAAGVASSGGGSISPAGDVVIARGASQTFYFTPEAGKRVESVTVDGVTFAWSALSYTLSGVVADGTLTVTFADVPQEQPDPVLPATHTVTARVEGQGGSVSPEGTTTVAEHGSLLITFTPQEGYRLESVSVDGQNATDQVAANGTLRLSDVTANKEVVATFAAAPSEPSGDDYRTVSASAGPGGTISPAGDVRVARGASQTFTVLANEGKKLASLTLIDPNNSTSTVEVTDQVVNSTFVLNDVQADHMLRAEFEDIPSGGSPDPAPTLHTVTATGTTGGTVSPVGAVQVADGSSLTYTFTPDAGYELAKVELDGTPLDAAEYERGVYELSNVKEGHTLHATFSAKAIEPQPVYHTVTAAVDGGHGSVSPAGEMRVKAGSSQTFTFTPDEGYTLDEVRVDGQPVAADGFTYTLSSIQADAALTATFRPLSSGEPTPPVPTTYEVRTQASAGGSVSPVGTTTVAEGSFISLLLVPEAGYEVASVTVNEADAISQVVDGVLRVGPVVDNVDVAVVFERTAPPEPTPADPVITATAGEGGTISPAGTLQVKRGSSQTFSLIPHTDYVVESLTIDGRTFPFTGTSYTLFDVQDDTTLSVTFRSEPGTPQPTTHVVHASASAGGSIVPEGDVVVTEGASVSFSFAPFAGYELYRVAVDGVDLGADELAKGTYRFTNVKAEHRIQAYFALEGDTPVDPDDPDKPTGYAIIKASAGDGGSISPSGDVKVALGESKTFEFTPSEGHEVDQVLVNGQAVQHTGNSYTFTDVRTGATLHVTFKSTVTPPPASHVIMASASSGGAISPSGRVVVDEGDSATFTFKPDANFELARVVVDGTDAPQADIEKGSYTFTNVTGPHTIKAEFKAVQTEPVEPTYVVVHASAGAGGAISPAGDVRVERGAGYTFSLIPEEGFVLDGVKVNDADASSLVQDGCRLVLASIDDETDVVATFRALNEQEPAPELPTIHTVRASSSTGGAISPRGSVQVVEGENATFLLAPDEGYRLTSILVDDIPVSASELADAAETGVFTLASVMANRSVRAEFELIPGVPTPEEPPYVNVDVEVKVNVSVGTDKGRGGTVSPEYVTVPRGTSTPFYVFPDTGFGLQQVKVNGSEVEFHELGSAPVRQAGVFAARAMAFATPAAEPGASGGYWFSVDDVQEDTVIEVTFRPLAEDEQPPAAVTTHTVSARASIGGSLSPAGDSLVPDGQDAIFAVKPDAGFKLSKLALVRSGVENDVTSQVASNRFVLAGVTEDAQLVATFEPETTGPVQPTYVTVHALAGEHGSISPAGDVRVQRGQSQTFSFIPDNGYTLDEVTVDGTPTQVDNFTLTLFDLQADTEVMATFRAAGGSDPEVPVFHAVTASATTGGSVSPSGVVQVANGSSVLFTFAPDQGYELSGVLLDDSAVPAGQWSNGTFRLENVTSEHRVEAQFSLIPTPPPGPEKVKVTATAGENGSISPSGVIDVTKGDNVVFSLIPKEGYAVDEVFVNNQNVSVSGNSYTLFNVQSATTIHVTFKQASTPPPTTHVIGATAGANGSIAPSGAVEVVHGEAQEFSFTPNQGYVVDTVLVDNVAVENPGKTYRFSNVSSNHTIHVTFRAEGVEPPPVKPTLYTIEAGVAGGHGRISPTGTVQVEQGTNRTFTFLPDAGYRVSALSIDGVKRSYTSSSYRFVNVGSNHTIEVTFSPVGAPAPSDPIDNANRVVQQATGFVKTGDGAGVVLVSALVIALAAGGVVLTARRRTAGGRTAGDESTRGGRR